MNGAIQSDLFLKKESSKFCSSFSGMSKMIDFVNVISSSVICLWNNFYSRMLALSRIFPHVFCVICFLYHISKLFRRCVMISNYSLFLLYSNVTSNGFPPHIAAWSIDTAHFSKSLHSPMRLNCEFPWASNLSSSPASQPHGHICIFVLQAVKNFWKEKNGDFQ